MPSAGSRNDGLSFDILKAYDPSEFPVTVNVVTAQGGEGILVRYWSDAISTDQANRLVAGIARVFVSFIESPSGSISSLQGPNGNLPLSQQDDQLRSRISLRRRSSILKKDDLAAVKETGQYGLSQDDAKSFASGNDALKPPVSPVSRMASIRRRFSTMSRSSRRRMSTDLGRKLLLLWSAALDVPADMVDKQDSFFRVGGDSIKAMKMAKAAREEGLVLTEPTEEDDFQAQRMDEIVDGLSPSGGLMSSQSLQLVNSGDIESDLLQADICPKIGFFKGGIADVLPGQLDVKRLRENCARVVDAFDILRTVFVCSADHFYQVILQKVRPSIVIYETHTDLDTFTASLQQRDRDQGVRQGEQFVQFILAKRRGTTQHRLLIRLSHAQDDGISITPEHYGYWTKLLKGSRMTDVVSRDHPSTYQTMGAYAEVRTTINISQNSTIRNITVGTLVQSAWALALAKLSADADVVFGLTVNGRMPPSQAFKILWTGLDLIRYLQDQLIASMPYESLGFREIIQRCTDSPCSTYFSTAVLHQNVEYEGHMDLDNQQYRVGGAGVIDNLADFVLPLARLLQGPDYGSIRNQSPPFGVRYNRNPHVEPHASASFTSHSPRSTPQTIPDPPRVSDQQLLTSQLKSQNISDILVHSAILSRTWQHVLPRMYSNQKIFQLDTSFYDLSGDLFALGQATWLLQQEGYQVRIEDLLARPTFLGHMAVLAQDVLGQSFQEDLTNTSQDEMSTPVGKAEKKVRWKKALGLMGKFSKRDSVSS
ncbi:hypothetical protein BDV11DRAFT_171250 [Aspergillus similis]